MDFAVGGPADAESALVVISGTHGPEGYTGSACQLGFLESSDLRNLFSSSSRGAGARPQPFGFAWMRRTTEGNVDLNRNYVDFNSALRGNPEYDRLHHAFVPKELNDPDAARNACRVSGATWCRRLHGRHAGRTAHPCRRPVLWRHQTQLVQRYHGRRPAKASRPANQRVVVIDIHTGLGPYGVPYLVHGYPVEDSRFGVMAEIFGEVMRSTAVKEEFDEDLPVDPEGPIVLAMDWVLPGKETFAYVIEYGTYPPNEVLGAHIADNWLHAYGDLNSDQGKAIKAELRRVMYPEFDDWKTMIWDEAVDALKKSAQGAGY